MDSKSITLITHHIDGLGKIQTTPHRINLVNVVSIGNVHLNQYTHLNAHTLFKKETCMAMFTIVHVNPLTQTHRATDYVWDYLAYYHMTHYTPKKGLELKSEIVKIRNTIATAHSQVLSLGFSPLTTRLLEPEYGPQAIKTTDISLGPENSVYVPSTPPPEIKVNKYEGWAKVYEIEAL